MELIYNDSPGSIPASYPVPGGLSFDFESSAVTFNGTAAAGSFVPCLSLYSQDGHLVGRWFPSQTFSVGDSGVVSFGPFLGRGGGTTTTTGSATIVDFVETTFAANLVINTTVQASAVAILTSNSVTFDGASKYKIEFYTPDLRVVSLAGGGVLDQGAFLNLWMDSTDLGIMRYLDLGADKAIEYAATGAEAIYITPSAGAHVFSVRGWLQVGPAEMRIIATSGRLTSTLVITNTGQVL